MVSDKQCSLCRFRYWVCITSIIRVITFSNIITVFARFTFSFWYFSLWYILLLDKGFNTKLYSKVNFFNTCDNTFKYYLSLCFFCIALKSRVNVLLGQHIIFTKLALCFCFFSHSTWLGFLNLLIFIVSKYCQIAYSFNNLFGVLLRSLY